MTTLYDALYNYAQNRQALTRWLHGGDIVEDYRTCLEYSTRQEAELLETLDGPARSQFEVYIGNVQGVRDYEQMVFFRQGLAMELVPGMRACRQTPD